MRLTYLLSAVLSVFVIAVSCKKSSHSSDNSNPLLGSWNFIDMVVQQNSIVTGGGKSFVTDIGYQTINNTGTVSFIKDSMTTAGFSYKVDTSAVAYTYQGNTLIDSVMEGYMESSPVSSDSVVCQLIGTDSVYWPGDKLIGPAGLGPGGPLSGGRFVITNDTLKITFNGTEVYPPTTETTHAVIYLKRQ